METSNLSNLIRSLKKSEKRYIVLYLSMQKENNYLKSLFQIISDDPAITDMEISEKIKEKKIISRLYQNKYELYQSILDALHKFDLRKSPYGRILTMLHQSEILLNKGLREARMELLLKAGQLADKYEFLELKLEIVRLRGVGTVDTNFLPETKLITDKIMDRAQLKHLNSGMIKFLNKTGERLTLTQKNYSTKILSAFKKRSLKKNSFVSKYVFFQFLAQYYTGLGEFDKGYVNGMKIVQLFKQYPDMLRIQIWRYVYCYRLHELLLASFKVSENKTAELVYNEILNLDISPVYKNDARINMLDYYIQTGEFKKGEKYLNNIQDQPVKDLLLYNGMVWRINVAIINFGSGNYSKALSWLNEILNSSKKQLADFPYTGITRLIRLVTYYELKKFDLLEYDIHSTSTYILKYKDKFKMDRLIMDCLLKMISINDKVELNRVMEEALSMLLKLARIKNEAKTLEIFDFVSWFKSKIENRNFDVVVKEKQKLK